VITALRLARMRARSGQARTICAIAGLLSIAAPAPVQAQGVAPRIEVVVGPRWTAGLNLASGDANELTSSGSEFRLFTASTTLARATSFDARFSVRVTERLRGLVSGTYGKPTLRISINNDIENAAAITATERLQQYAVRGGASWLLVAGSRFAPFVVGEVGYLRELHDEQTLVQTGRVIEIGGGATYPLVSNARGPFGQVGARVDVRAVLRSKGAALDGGIHAAPAVGVGLSLGF
jgi:hypothetical protein